MKLSKETLAILKIFSGINSSIVLKPGSFIMTKTVNNVVFAEANIDDVIDEELAIYELSSFLNLVSLVGDDAELTLDGEDIVISAGKTRVFYRAANASTIVTPKNRLTMPVANVIFELSADQMQQILRTSRAQNGDVLSIASDDNKIVIRGFNRAIDKDCLRPLFSVETADWDGPDFDFRLNMANMHMKEADFKILISSKGAVKFESDKISYVVATEATSTHSF
ncbi:sliding clamp, DNA polymerase accessory protein [Serratia phage PS2]|uniref:Sliding clamp n=1 Tax=Serratia phage PS2 TaxID=1481112 RepID=A0A023W4Q0_9CAUD|nr:DNA polymerase processivity factor [Serratia phage PS2]AHY25304.1 sliding clamp, DNA polymerase accessory protein [Serratia phage PS2]